MCVTVLCVLSVCDCVNVRAQGCVHVSRCNFLVGVAFVYVCMYVTVCGVLCMLLNKTQVVDIAEEMRKEFIVTPGNLSVKGVCRNWLSIYVCVLFMPAVCFSFVCMCAVDCAVWVYCVCQ